MLPPKIAQCLVFTGLSLSAGASESATVSEIFHRLDIELRHTRLLFLYPELAYPVVFLDLSRPDDVCSEVPPVLISAVHVVNHSAACHQHPVLERR